MILMKYFFNNSKLKSESKLKSGPHGRQAGFTLVETLVAVAIFSVSIAAMISVVARGVASTTAAKSRIVANYLAQEGIEYMRHMRNKYSEANGASFTWNDFVAKVVPCDQQQNPTNKCALADPAVLDPVEELIPCLDTDRCNDRPIYFDSAGYYVQSSVSAGQATPFRRYIVVTLDPLYPHEVRIQSSVVWSEKNGVDKNITLTETLTDWLPRATQ